MTRLEWIGPKEENNGKALQLIIRDEVVLALASSNYRHHEILKELLNRESIAFAKQRVQGPYYGPQPNGAEYQLMGAGWARLYKVDFELWGGSEDYKIGPSQEHANRWNNSNPPKRITVEIPKSIEPIALTTHSEEDDENPF